MACLGRLEARLARHFPELPGIVGIDNKSTLALLEKYGSPAWTAADGAAARQLMRDVGGPLLAPPKVADVIAAARDHRHGHDPRRKSCVRSHARPPQGWRSLDCGPCASLVNMSRDWSKPKVELSQSELCEADWALGKLHEPVERLRAAVVQHPADEDLWRLLALATTRARRWHDLANAMAHARDRFASPPWIWPYLVAAALGLGDPDDAVRVAVAGLRACATAAEHDRALIWDALGHAFWKLGDHAAVLEASAAIRALGGDEASADLFELRVAAARSEHAHVLAIGARLMASRPDAHEPLALVTASSLVLDASNAVELATRLVALGPTSPTGLMMLASAHALRHDFARACDAQAQTVALTPDDDASQLAQVLYQLAAERPGAAHSTALRLLRRQSEARSTWLVLADTARSLGDVATCESPSSSRGRQRPTPGAAGPTQSVKRVHRRREGFKQLRAARRRGQGAAMKRYRGHDGIVDETPRHLHLSRRRCTGSADRAERSERSERSDRSRLCASAKPLARDRRP